MSIYLDNAATTRVCPEAAEAAMNAMTLQYGNPSSTHRMGREAKKLLDSFVDRLKANKRLEIAVYCGLGALCLLLCLQAYGGKKQKEVRERS